MKCWMCNEVSNTGEHKIKKSLLNSVFKDEFKNKEMMHYKDKKLSPIQGVDSKKIKYENIFVQNVIMKPLIHMI